MRRWEPALQLCRFVKDSVAWACLAALALKAGLLESAEAAFAALGQVRPRPNDTFSCLAL